MRVAYKKICGSFFIGGGGMSATLIAIAKKIAVMILTDKRTWKFIGSIIAGVLTITLLPLMVLLSMSNQMEQIGLSPSAYILFEFF